MTTIQKNKKEINTNEVYNQYRNITETCITDGYLLPKMLKNMDIPKEYKLTDKEKQTYFNETSNETREKLYDMIKQVEEDTRNKTKKEQEEYYNQELEKFIQVYPKYKSIIL